MGSSRVRAPDLAGLWGRPVATGDGAVTADAACIRDSILRPEKRIAAGYEDVMPSFDGLVDESELHLLVACIRSLAPGEEPGATAGEEDSR